MENKRSLQLKNELAIYENLMQEDRHDEIQQIVMARVKKRIKQLGENHGTGRKTHTEYGRAKRVIYNVLQNLHRAWNHKNTGDYFVPQIFENSPLQKQGAAK
jgi:hypothetical protein